MVPGYIVSLMMFFAGQSPSADKILLDRADAAHAKIVALTRALNASTSVARTKRLEIKAKTGVDVDINPYDRLDDVGRLLACIIAAEGQGTKPELILALWVKEASAKFGKEAILSGALAVTTADDAKSMFIAMNLFRFMGGDRFVRFKATGDDNMMLENGSFAKEHGDTLDAANAELTAAGVAKFDYAKVMRDNLTVTGGTAGQPFKVEAGPIFLPAMLAISHALFNKFQTEPDALLSELGLTFPVSDFLTYMIYNNGRGAKRVTGRGAYAFIKSSQAKAAAAGEPLEQWLTRTRIVGRSWQEPRSNLVRFQYYLDCYAPIFT